jgi:hypothetical protein
MATCAIFHDGQFWTGIFEWEDGGEVRAVRRVFGAEPSEDDVLRFVAAVRPEDGTSATEPTDAARASNYRRRLREAKRAMTASPVSTKSQLVLAAERERRAGERSNRRRAERREERERKFLLSQEKAKQKRRGH